MAKIYTAEERTAWMKTLHGNPAGAAMLLETADRRLLVVKANYKVHWTLPGGVVDESESPFRAALRETKEEVGLDMNENQTRFAGVVYCHSDDVDVYRFIFHARITDEQLKSVILQESEIEDYTLVTSEQIMDGENMYAPNVVTWAKEQAFPVYSEEVDTRL